MRPEISLICQSVLFELPHDKTNKMTCAFAQSDQSICCPHEETLGPQLPIERTAKTSDWADVQADQSSLGTQVILLVLSCGGSFHDIIKLTSLAPDWSMSIVISFDRDRILLYLRHLIYF